jgi:type II secretory pathway pseudopilin PulG
MIVVAIIGILAMVAIPSFTKYIRRSKTVEATMNIRRLYDSSVSYFQTERAGRAHSASMVPRQFPITEPLFPPPDQYKCCEQPGGKCPAPASRFDFPGGWSFNLLNFDLPDPFYFHYRYDSDGTERESRFTAGAQGDLDCDDDWSTYERTGSVDGQFNVVGGGGLYIYNDIE